MNAKDLREWIASLTQGIEFEFQNKDYYIDPFSATHIELYAGEKALKCTNIDMVMTAPFFDGKCLNEIADKIKLI